MSHLTDQSARDNHANQLNPCHTAYWKSRGYEEMPPIQDIPYIIEAGKKIKPEDNEANIKNPNKGTPGTNPQYDQAQGDRGKQLNPNHKKTH
ncbi:hypothetical protein QUF61_06825 [Candidatus Venteria ishoeyi]|uniref:hypothetical protein n=1 Tax=Candidatus Venteria ishoeyi TaxID=1899563 RepID=UPI0025A5FD12|nr:hypothetical protein [Candidatus Venteria ishoeyi]MDM8546191.1 hypothetical protein [Candidatus Venteria ishoeyi]